MKSKGVAYLLWFFLGIIGVHKFYLEKHLMGVIYLFTGGLLGIGWLIDLFTLSNQVDMYNALHQGGGQQQAQQQSQNIVVNVGGEGSGNQKAKVSAEKQILAVAEQKPQFVLKDIINNTELESEEAVTVVDRMIERGLVKEIVDASGKKAFEAI